METTALRTAFCAVLETALNPLLAADPKANERLKPLIGKTIQLDLADFPTLWFAFHPVRIDVLSVYAGTPSAALTLTWQGLKLLSQPELLTQLIRDNQIDMHGDPALIQAFSRLFSDLHIDLEDKLAPYTGDVLAYWLGKAAGNTHRFTKKRFQSGLTLLRQTLTSDAGPGVSGLELASFCDDVHHVARQTEDLLQRADSLLNRSST